MHGPVPGVVLPDAVRELREQVCVPLGLAFDRGQLQQLLDFEALLLRWNATYNLSAVRDHDGVRRQHLADCLAVVGPMARELARRSTHSGTDGARILDVGSGGGLPGAVLAIAWPQATVWCIDAVGKKAAFVRQVAATLGVAGLRGVHARVETLQAAQRFDLITCRAWTTLDAFVSLTRPLLAPGGVWAAMKARRGADEAAALPPGVAVFHVEPLTVPMLDGERCIVWMRPDRTHPSDGPAGGLPPPVAATDVVTVPSRRASRTRR